MPGWEISSRAASRRATSAPTSQTPISRLRGNSMRRLSSRAEHPTSSGEPAPARADHPQTSPAVLEVSPFSFAERTAFVGRESERSTIRAAIDRALTGHGSVVMLAGGPGVGKTRLAMEMAEYASRVGFRYLVGHCYERDEPVPFLPFAEILESGLAQAPSQDDFRRRMGDNAAELAQIAPSLRRVFPDIPQPLELPPAQKRRYLFQSVSEMLAGCSSNSAIIDTRGSSLGRRIHAGAFDSSGQSGSSASSRNNRDLSRRIFGKQSGIGQNSGRADSSGDPSA